MAAILHIGNVKITATRADDALMPDPSQAERVCHLLGIPVSEFTKAVLRPRVLAGREWVTQARTKQQATDELAALCKTLYERSFGLLVDRINRALDRPSSKTEKRQRITSATPSHLLSLFLPSPKMMLEEKYVSMAAARKKK